MSLEPPLGEVTLYSQPEALADRLENRFSRSSSDSLTVSDKRHQPLNPPSPSSSDSPHWPPPSWKEGFE